MAWIFASVHLCIKGLKRRNNIKLNIYDSLFIVHIHVGCGQISDEVSSAPAPFIIGGELADPGEWPWVASLFYLGKYCSVLKEH